MEKDEFTFKKKIKLVKICIILYNFLEFNSSADHTLNPSLLVFSPVEE